MSKKQRKEQKIYALINYLPGNMRSGELENQNISENSNPYIKMITYNPYIKTTLLRYKKITECITMLKSLMTSLRLSTYHIVVFLASTNPHK